MKRKLNRLLALLLCAVMMSSDFTGFITPAQAAPAAPDSISAAAPLADTAENGDPKDFDANINARPNLFVHFLGDNYFYPYGTPAGLGKLPVPAGFDQSKETNPDSTEAGAGPMDTPGNTWNRYRDPAPGGDMVAETGTSGAQVIFWVGLGIDRREIFELLKDNKGLTSLEAGFYYDDQYIEPYVDASGSFKTTIETANINNTGYPANTQWSSDYEILRAETGLETKTDPITQEEVISPSFDQIMADSNWKMTYVSLELKDPLDPAAKRRLAGEYVGVDNLPTDANGDPVTPESAHGTGMQNALGVQAENDYQYLLLIPFRLKRYGDPQKLALRLARNATHFSMGAGQEGETTYAAWERVTTRNPGKDIKLLTRFNGDLFLFGDHTNNGEVEYTATLYVDRKTALNTAELSVDGDPAVWPVKATQHEDVIQGLRSGLGMRIKTDPQSGYTVTVTVKYKDADENYIIHTYQVIDPDHEYTFVMPEVPNMIKNVEVHIGFSIDNPRYHVFLSEVNRDSLGAVTATKKLGNDATITTNLDNATEAVTADTVEIHSYDPPYTPHPTHAATSLLDAHDPGPMGLSDAGNRVKIEVSTHADYMAVVRIGNFNATGSLITSGLTVSTAKNDHRVEANTASPNFGKITLPYGGTITLTMPANDLDVEITYQPATRYKATLEVYHKAGSTVTPMNTAQMAYLIYDDFNVSSTAYSGVVYHLKNDTVENHRAVKGGADNKKLPWVAASQATLSGSLAGDAGRAGMDWNPREMATPEDPVLGLYAVMTQLRSAVDLDNFATTMSALDLNDQAVGSAWTGLRKDLQGQSYGDGDVLQLKSYLWEMRTRILNDPALKATYDKTVTQTVGPTTTTLYSYLDLTAAQVQAYVLDVLDAQEIERVNLRQYDLAYQAYLQVKALRDIEDAKPALAGQIEPLSAPIPPERMPAADANGVRRFQDTDYQNGSAGDYLYDYYAYLDRYRTYITTVASDGSITNATPPGTAPAKKALHTIDIRPDDDGSATDAESKLAAYSFKPNPVGSSASIETREDRTVWIALEGDSAYYVESVQLYSVDEFNNATGLIATVTPTQSSSYANLWSFTMPKQNCVVRVTYARRTTRDMIVQIIDADGETDNLASVEAYRPADHDTVHYPTEVPSVSPVLGVITNAGNHNITPYPSAPALPTDPDPRYIYNVFTDSTVTIRVKAKEGYTTEVKLENLGRGDTIPYTKVTAPNPADGDLYTFLVDGTTSPGDVVSVTITYIQDRDQYDAYMRYYTVPGTSPNPDNMAEWRLENPGPPASVTWTDFIPDVYVGTHLVGDVTVQPGYYIYGVVARGASGNYSYTMSGDGYNNGYGTMVSGTNQPVKINVDMPSEDLYVEVYFKKGPPDPEPSYPLTLTVKDDDNVGDDPSMLAQNWAKATVYDLKPDGTPDTSSPLGTLGEVGRHEDHGNGKLVDYGFYNRGKWVKVDFKADAGYHVSKVSVGPSELGVAMIWESANSVSFYMPAGSTGINVEFAKGEAPAYFLTVRETWFDMAINGPVEGSEKDNYVTRASSGTIRGWNSNKPVELGWDRNPERVPGADATASARGAAVSGEEVTMTYIVDEDNWYVQSIILFSDGAATRLTDKAVDVTPATATDGKKTYEVKFNMPSGDAEFAVHYRKGPRPEKNDYAFTMVLYDSDNTDAVKDDNRFSASFTDATGGAGVHPDVELGLGLATPITNDVRHIHPGDIVTLETQLQPGYTVDYVIINPSNLGLYPSWQSVVTDASGVTKGVAKFTMPNEGVAVVARYIKGEPHKYTANLILRPPAGYTVSDVGMGTFAAPTTGSFDAYPTKAVYSTAQPAGTAIDYDLYAKDGFYIEKVTIEPAVGATASLSGSFGYQNGDFVMPAADVNVNVWFKRAWPDDAKYGLTLEVHDASEKPGNYAAFRSAGSTVFTPGDNDKVHGGESKTIWGAAFDRDTVVVDISAEAGFYYDADAIFVTDTQGNAISWWYVPGGIAFTMPPRSTKVVVTFKDDPGDRKTYEANLVVINAKTTAGDAADNDEVELKAVPTYASNSPLTATGTIRGLYPQDELTLTTRPGTGRHISSAYAVCSSGGRSDVIPIYEDGTLVAPPALAQMVPGDPANAVTGRLAMPECDITVYVKFADGEVRDTSKWVNLKVTGPADAGFASAVINEGASKQSMTVATPGSTTPAGAEQGMDTRITTQGREVIVTFEPDTANGYDITKLEVYDRYGNLVPYTWISMVQDPPALTDTDMWPDPPTDPTPTITHPTWVNNPKRQIKLTVPVDCVTVHVTYGKVADREFNAQIVVNDPYPANTTPTSRNNAWFGLLDDTLKERIRTAKPGEWIDLSLNVHPGYKIEYIKVVPQSYGIAPGLPLGDIYDQNTGFYMPNGDCTVYVKFAKDETELKVATVVAVGAPTGNSANYATIHSPISGTSAHAIVNGLPREAQARPTVDWITVDYYWAAGDAIESISVQTREGAGGTDLPYTQNEDIANRHGQIVLPMAAKDVLITIVYKDDPTPVGQEVVLHVIDKDRGVPASIVRDPVPGGEALNYGRLQAVYAVGADTGLIGPDTAPLATDPYESTATIYVPAGERVDVTACSDILGLDSHGKVYIESAFVLYEAGGQMLNMNFQPDSATPPPYGFSGPKASYFTVHQGRNDVYVTLTREQPRQQNEYSAVLMLKGPVDNSGQAGICVGSSYNTAPVDRRDELTQANHGYAYVTAAQGEGITVNVIPAEGYAIDYIQVTPLGYPLTYTYLMAESTITFDMPHCNIAITVYLKKAEKDQYTLTLHYLEDTGTENKDDYAKISWTKDDGSQDTIWAWHKSNVTRTPPGATTSGWDDVSTTLVKAGAPVTLWATLDEPDVILAAYVLSEGELVPLTPTFPTDRTPSTGLEGVGENASAGDNYLADALATFDMPSADAHVYLVTTNAPPPEDWHTIILTASDTSPAGNNRGLNEGYLNESGKPDADRKTVISDGGITHAILTLPEYEADGTTLKYFTVDTKPYPSYELSIPKTHMTKNTPVYVQTMTPVGTTPTVHYEEPVGNCNKVVHLIFESQEDLTLTVEIEDPDNPGNGTVTNAVTAATTGVDTLTLNSYSIAGSYQIMSGVTAGAPVNLTVTPADGYYAYAWLYTVGADPVEVPLTAASNGTLTGSFPMPANTSRVVVTFYIPYNGTLVLKDNSGYPTLKAQMTESTGTAPDSVSVNAMLSPSGTLTKLPNGTVLDANMVDFYGEADAGRKVTGLLTVNGSTTLLPPELGAGNIDHYKHTIDRTSATITLVVDNKGTNEENYIAAVRTVNKPAGTADPTIVDTTTSGKVSGSIWTTADDGDGIRVHVTVPAGYTARITTDSALALDGGAVTKTLTADGDTTFVMPAKNVQVTVEYLRTHHRLTLHITDTSGVTGNTTHATPAAGSVLGGGLTDLDADGESTYVRTGAAVDLTATPAADAKIKYIFYQVDGQAPVFVTVTDPTDPFSAVPLLAMPAANVDVTVVYTSAKIPDPPPDPDPQDYYIAMAVKVDGDNDPGNQILSIRNTTRTTLLDGTDLPSASPVWTAGYAEDAVQVSYQAAPGYYVKVTAAAADGTPILPVLQIGDTSLGTAATAFPKVGENIVITVTYTKEKPDYPKKDVALQLVEHEQERGNKAQTTDFTDAALMGLALDGTYTTHAPGYPSGVASDDPVERQEPQSSAGNDLRTLANWASGYQVIRMTVAVRNTISGDETGEVDLPVSRYGANATSRCPMPPVGDDEIAVIRVYYGNIYDATLHVVGADVPYDVTRATDNRPNPISSTGTVPITNTDDKLMGFNGGEKVMTTAIPDAAGIGGTKKRLVGVVWESDLTGARATTSTVNDRYDFDMPKDNVDFYAVYEPEPDDPKDRTYIAKVALANDSQSIAGTQNALSIRNTDNTTAASGKYWVAAKDGDSVVVNVKVAKGYQAQIITTKVDDQSADVLNALPDIFDGTNTRKPTSADDYQYYISRTQFIYNLPDGKDATFTMPANTDATVTVRFTKGYDLTMELTDLTTRPVAAGVTTTNETQSGVTAQPPAVDDYGNIKNTAQNTSAGQSVTDVINGATPGNTISDLPGDLLVKTDLTVDPTLTNVRPQHLQTTLFTGTRTIPATDTDQRKFSFDMGYEDTTGETVLLDKKWLAKVELAGDSDVVGNAAAPVKDYTDPTGNITGTVWTTTDESDTIDLTITVRAGYEAKIQVRRDNAEYYKNLNDPDKWEYLDAWRYHFTKTTETGSPAVPTTENMVSDPGKLEADIFEVSTTYASGYLPASLFPDTISGEQHFRFTMPKTVAATGAPGDADYVPGDDMSDVTIIVTFEKVNDMPRPYDPNNPKMEKIDLDRGFIYGENRAEYAVIQIPTLATVSESETKLFDTDNYAAASTTPVIHDATKTADTEVKRYIFALYNAGTDKYTELAEGTDIILAPYDEETLADPGDLYNYILGLYEGNETLDDTATTERKFVGSKFIILPKPKADGTFTPNGQKLYDMLNNNGSLESYTADGKTRYRTTLAVMAEDAAKRQSDYTPVWIRPWFALGVNVISYAPTHELTGELYLLMDEKKLDVLNGYMDEDEKILDVDAKVTLDPGNFKHYQWNSKQEPLITDSIVLENDAGSGKWFQVLRIRSSELLGAFTTAYDPTEDFTANPQKTLLDNVEPNDNLTYALAIKKDANLTYKRVEIDLNPHNYKGTDQLADYYMNGKAATRTFMIQDTVHLITGDVDGNQRVKFQDYDYIYDFVYRSRPWNRSVKTEPVKPTTPPPTGGATSAAWDAYYAAMAEWDLSTYNPNSWSYRADLDGDRKLTVADLDIVRTLFNYNRTEADYNWRQTVDGVTSSRLPFGLGARSNDYAALFSAGRSLEGEAPADEYWDQPADLDSEEAEPLETPWVDGEGKPYLEDFPLPETPEESGDHVPAPSLRPGERVEIPLGEEAQGQDGRPYRGQDAAGVDMPVPMVDERPLGEAEPQEPEPERESVPTREVPEE